MRLTRLLFQSKPNYLLNYKDYGNPTKVINLLKETIESPKQDQVQLGFICSPINPSDLNQIQGVYPKRPEFTPEFGAIGGNEGVAKVIEVGKNLQDKFEIGDWVIPNKSCLGTWRKFGNFDANEIHKVPKIEGVKAEMVGMLGVNPCTAYRMLKDFADLKKGDWVIQNGSNSAVGQGIIQLCRIWGINTLNIVREREGIETVKEELKALGANITVTDKEFRSSEFQENLKNQGITFKVGFNCVGGKLVNDMAKVLENKANLVTYGGMSREPVTLSTSNLIFKQINFTGYWMAEWNESAKLSERKEMWTALLKLMASGEFKLPGYEVFSFKDCNEESFEKIKQSLTLSNKGGGSKLKKLIQFD